MVRQIKPSSANSAFDYSSDHMAQRRLARESTELAQIQPALDLASSDARADESTAALPARASGSGESSIPRPVKLPLPKRMARKLAKQVTKSALQFFADSDLAAEPAAQSAVPGPIPTQLRTSTAQQLVKLKKNWRWHFVWIGAMGLFAGTGLGAYLWLAGLPPLPDCGSITPLSPDANRLYCAQETARSGKLEDLIIGINLVKDWSPNHPLYRNSQQALAKWSRLVTLAARDKMNQNDFKGAAAAINKIPASSPAYAEAQKTLSEWQTQWQKGETFYTKAVEAMNQQNWKLAFEQVTELGYLDHDYWRLTQADSLSRQISVQKSSQESLKQAKKLAAKLMPDEMGEAIALLQGVAPDTAAWAESQNLLTTWSQNLLKIALQRWQAGDTASAIQLAAQVPLALENLEIEADAADLVKFSHAHQLVAGPDRLEDGSDSLGNSSAEASRQVWRQLWHLTEAIAAVSQISSESPVYAAAQLKLQDWQTQLQDLQQLQTAQIIADFGQRPLLDYASQQASQIPADHPRYSQAQQLVTAWQQKIQQLEDLPYLRLAQQFAAAQTVSGLQLAIAQAQVIPNGRAIWTEAQAQVLTWQQQIERLEDQPLLDQATQLAKANKLDEAIAKAAEIRPERVLYAPAQAAIETWKEKIRAALLAEDQAVLDQARNAAGSGDLTGGIAAAAQLSPGRPLYMEAQSLIGAWLRERDGDPKSAPDASSLIEDSASRSSSPDSSSPDSSSDRSEAAADSGLNSAESSAESSTEPASDSLSGSASEATP